MTGEFGVDEGGVINVINSVDKGKRDEGSLGALFNSLPDVEKKRRAKKRGEVEVGILRLGGPGAACYGPVSSDQVCLQPPGMCKGIASHSQPVTEFDTTGWVIQAPPTSKSPLACYRGYNLSDSKVLGARNFGALKDVKMIPEKWFATFEHIDQGLDEVKVHLGNSTLAVTPGRKRLKFSDDEAMDLLNFHIVIPSLSGTTEEQAGATRMAIAELSDVIPKIGAELRGTKRRIHDELLVIQDGLVELNRKIGSDPKLEGCPSDSVWTGVQNAYDAALSSYTTARALEQQASHALAQIATIQTKDPPSLDQLRQSVADAANAARTATSNALQASQAASKLKQELSANLPLLARLYTAMTGPAAHIPGHLVLERLAALERSSNPSVGLGVSACGNSIQPDVMKTLEDQGRRIVYLEASMGNKAYSVGRFHFRNRDDVRLFVTTHMKGSYCYELFKDCKSLLSHIGEGVIDVKTSQSDEVHAAKTSFSPMQTHHHASFKGEIPSILGGSTALRSALNPFGAITTPDKWDCGDELTGVKNIIERKLVNVKSTIENMVDVTANPLGSLVPGAVGPQPHGMDAEAQNLALKLLDQSTLFWDKWSNEINNLFTFLTRGRTGAAAIKEAWGMDLASQRVVLEELHSSCVFAAEAFALPTAEDRCVKYLWATLQAHRVQDEFIKFGFRRHPRIAPRLTMFLFESRTPLYKTVALEKTVQDQAQTIKTLTSRLDKLETKVSKMK